MSDHVLYEREGNVARVVLNRPDRHNALLDSTFDEIVEAIRRGERDDDVKVVVLKGNGPSFSVGFDRTGEPGARHCGISVLVVPVDAPGITVRALATQSDGRTNEVFFEGVRVPVTARVGGENEGWGVVSLALDLERLRPYAGNRHYLERLVA